MLIIGAGRVGTGLHNTIPNTTLISRTEGWDALEGEPGTPVIVATRNDDLAAVLDRVPAPRRDDLVFVQNGMLRPWLKENDLAGATRGLLFFAVSKRGDSPAPGAPSPFWGPHAEAVVASFAGAGLPAEVVGAEGFLALEFEKLAWNCIFGLLCEVHDTSVGTLVEAHHGDIHRLAGEMLAVGSRELAVTLDHERLTESLCAYSRGIPTYRGAVKEWPWRNGWFHDRAGGDMPFHAQCLGRTGHP